MAEIRENGILGQESVSRVNGLSSGLEKVRRCSSKERKKKKLANLGSRLLGNLDDLIHNEVALLGGRRTNQVRLISLSQRERRRRRSWPLAPQIPSSSQLPRWNGKDTICKDSSSIHQTLTLSLHLLQQ